jgi:Family of unknown function (DUF5906)
MDGSFGSTMEGVQQTQSPSFEFTFIESRDPLTKTYELGADGRPCKAADPYLAQGTAHRTRISLSDFPTMFPELLDSCDHRYCIVLGAIARDIVGEVADITTKDRYKTSESGEGRPLIYRGQASLGYRAGEPAIVGLDHDRKELPPHLSQRLEESGGFYGALTSIVPSLAGAARVIRPSVSTGIYATATNEGTVGGGLHVYIPISDGGDAKDFVKRLHHRLLLAGWGYPYVSRSGAIFIRSLLDTAASGGERLWFEAPAILGDGLAHLPGSRTPIGVGGAALDTKLILPDLTSDEVARVREIERELRASVVYEAEAARRRYTEVVRERLAQRGGDAHSADGVVSNLLDAETRGVLNGRHVLYLDDGRVVSVADVIMNRSEYHRSTCSDPLEPEYGGGRNKAVLFTDDRYVRLFSHAHGGRLYTLAYDEDDVVAAALLAASHGQSEAVVIRKYAHDVLFRSGGWKEIEDRTSTKAADALGFGDVDRSEQHDTANHRPPVFDDDPAIDALIREFNERFAIVGEGGSASVVRLAYNAELERRTPVSMTLDAFKLLYGNKYVNVPRKRNGGIEYQEIPGTTAWLKHPARRTCPDGFGIDPYDRLPSSCFNMWQGFGVEEREGDWSKLNEMIFDVLASGNESYYTYIIQWLAHLVQRPHESPGVALVFRGDEGVGKGTLGRAIMRLMRPHAMQITHTKHLTGSFNSHLRTVLFLFADEAFFAGDRANEGTLKGLITEQFRMNESKGRDATLGRNRIHLMMASNNEWVVPASAEARRYAVFDVASHHKRDTRYFGPINQEMDTDGKAAGIAAMLYDLRRISLDVNLVMKAPETAGLHRQRIASLRGPARWMFDVLVRGCVNADASESWPDSYSTDELYRSYQAWAQETKQAYPASRHEVGEMLNSMFKPYRPRKKDAMGTGDTRPPSYRFGPLAVARQIFSEKTGIGSSWHNNPVTEGSDDGSSADYQD